MYTSLFSKTKKIINYNVEPRTNDQNGTVRNTNMKYGYCL